MFVCGPLHGEPFTALHARFAPLRRIAVGVTIIDPADPAYTGFDLVLARDGDPGPPVRDLAAAVVPDGSPPVPVTGIALAMGQGEYRGRRRHEAVAARLTEWVGSKECAPVTLETRLDPRDWRLCSTAEAFGALLSGLDIVVTTRLHGLALALRAGIPVLAVDPVEGAGRSPPRRPPGGGRRSWRRGRHPTGHVWTRYGTGACPRRDDRQQRPPGGRVMSRQTPCSRS